MINKIVDNIEQALEGVESNMTFMFGGLGFQEFLKMQLLLFPRKKFLD
jgi:hypothetical protein